MKLLLTITISFVYLCGYGQYQQLPNIPLEYRTGVYEEIKHLPNDTIPVVLIYIDTSHYILWEGSNLEWDSVKSVFNVIERIDTIYFDDVNQKGGSRWKFGYEVREKHNNTEGAIDPYMSQGFQYREYWVHLYYLDDKKKPLPVSNIILQSINRK